MVEAIDKKANFPAPRLRYHRTSSSKSQSLQSAVLPASPGSAALPVGGNGNAGAGASASGVNAGAANGGGRVDKGKGKDDGKGSEEFERPKVISKELRALLSRKVEVLPRKVVRKGGAGRNTLGK